MARARKATQTQSKLQMILFGGTWTIDSGCFQFQRIGYALF